MIHQRYTNKHSINSFSGFQVSAITDEGVTTQERFCLLIFIVLLIVGDFGQVIALCDQYFGQDSQVFQKHSLLFKANLNRLKALALILRHKYEQGNELELLDQARVLTEIACRDFKSCVNNDSHL